MWPLLLLLLLLQQHPSSRWHFIANDAGQGNSTLLFQQKDSKYDSDVGETRTSCSQRFRCLSCQEVLNLTWESEQSHDQIGEDLETGEPEYDDPVSFVKILDRKINFLLPDQLRSCRFAEITDMPAPEPDLVQCLQQVQPSLLSLLQETRSAALVGAWELWHLGMLHLLDRFLKATHLQDRLEHVTLQVALIELCGNGTDELTRNISTALRSLIQEDPLFPDGDQPPPALRIRMFRFVLMLLWAFFVPGWANQVATRRATAHAQALH